MATHYLPQSPFDRAAIGLGPTTIFLLVLAITWVLPAGPLTALFGALLVVFLLVSPGVANGAALRLALPFAVMLVWGIAMSQGNDTYIIGKDAWYAGKLCLCLMLGFLIGIRTVDDRPAMDGLISLAGIMAVVTIALWLRSGATLGELDSEDATRLPLVATVAVVPLLDRLRSQTGVARGQAIVLLALIVLAVLASNSRITIITLGVMFLAWAGLFSRTRRALIGGAVVLAILALLWQFLPEYNGGELTVAIKLRRSLDEMLLTDSVDPTEMILNWRGFEAYNAQLMIDQATILRKIFGYGLGATIDLGQEIPFEDGPIRFPANPPQRLLLSDDQIRHDRCAGLCRHRRQVRAAGQVLLR
ncbi:O-antigen ligase family protein [Sphingomonas sp. H160509]|uniref:O-antigen ligase family protein n=1 Tax=Sphingomonas sp. H160509 TaxID=2955313 RepID=UPI002098174A|nr:O-antigen ligase family protein [Sphingomonas sp. H160509]MDD1453010.1 O-antigen ligase family protein [Sphingomonas sp. H160509]